MPTTLKNDSRAFCVAYALKSTEKAEKHLSDVTLDISYRTKILVAVDDLVRAKLFELSVRSGGALPSIWPKR